MRAAALCEEHHQIEIMAVRFLDKIVVLEMRPEIVDIEIVVVGFAVEFLYLIYRKFLHNVFIVLI